MYTNWRFGSDFLYNSIDNEDFVLEEHKTRLGEFSTSLSLVWADIFLTCFSLLENSRKTHFCLEIKEAEFDQTQDINKEKKQ